MWLALCDQKGHAGPKDETCKKLSEFLSISVDFAKHGECVNKVVINEIK